MDTIFLWIDKRILSALCVLLSFFMIGTYTAYTWSEEYFTKISAPTINNGEMTILLADKISHKGKIQEFDEIIQKKYPKATIYNVTTGVKHIKLTKYFDRQPVKINITEINKQLTQNFELRPVLASENLAKKSKISNIAKDSIVAINGTFFKPETGVPLGILMIDKKIYTGPIYNRVAFGIFDDKFEMDRITLNASIKSKDNQVKIDNINQPRMLSTMTLVYTNNWGDVAPATPKYGLQIVVDKDRIIAKSANSQKIPQDGYVIVGPASHLNQFEIGEKVELNITTTPQWKNVKHIISGGPFLVKDNEIFVDMTAQKLASIGGKNPRSAIGYTKNNNIIIVAVDGREENSVGITLMQLANFMKSLGCVQAMNLDGGGSTVMYVDGKVVNNPQQKGGIPISNIIGLIPKS